MLDPQERGFKTEIYECDQKVSPDRLPIIFFGLKNLTPNPPEIGYGKRYSITTYPGQLFLKALMIMIFRQLHTYLAYLGQPLRRSSLFLRRGLFFLGAVAHTFLGWDVDFRSIKLGSITI